MKRKIIRLLSLMLCCFLLVGLLPVTASADNASVAVYVGTENYPLKGASFVLTGTGYEKEETSDENGIATFSAVPAGSYTLKEKPLRRAL